ATVTGVITADTGDIPGDIKAPDGREPFVTIQNGFGPWVGMALRVRDSAGDFIGALTALHRGDSVTVHGRVEEFRNMTVLWNASVVANHGPTVLPEPFPISTEVVARKREGETIDPERWEGVLVEYPVDSSENVVVVRVPADPPTNDGEFL